MKDFRFDVRTESQFKKDMIGNHACEAEIAIRLCIYKQRLTGKWPELRGVGADPTGAFIEKASAVSTDPDFKIDNKLVEITRADSICKRVFHQKTGKVKRCISNGHFLAFINGYTREKEPLFLVLSPQKLQAATEASIQKYGVVPFIGGGSVGAINKDAYRYEVGWFENLWLKLPSLVKRIPADYQDILDIAKGKING